MSLAVVDFAALTNTGMVRRSNEDSHLAAPPVFVVADGMGGARAGEIASGLCIETFEERIASAGPPEEFLRETIVEANRRIHEMAASDPTTAGMGTTVTSAVVADGVVTFGHVGDSRAYRLRSGVLRQMTDDHSLVGELVRRGAITPQEAAVHPQRSIITRALGTEENVEVDTFTIDLRDGDVFLLCSDGLSGMVGDELIHRTLSSADSLSSAARELIQAANAAGGDDNITAVLLRVGAGDPAVAPVVADNESTPEMIFVDVEPSSLGGGGGALRRFLIACVTLAVVGVLIGGGALFLRWSHFVGATKDGHVAVYQGVPFDVTSSVRLYRTVRVSAVPVSALTQSERELLFDHAIVSLGDAQRRVDALPATAYWGASSS